MAKSKTGGSRAYLRGRVGSDVYSIGVDAKGKKQQVVRSLAESVKNPQTAAQMRGRMIMSTVMQAVSAMRPIIDHAFDNVPAGQPAISEFIKRNYALIKDDVQVHASGDNVFGLNRYQEKGAKQGAYVISVGSAIGVKGIVTDGTNKTLTIDLTGALTIGGLKQALGIGVNDYFTACAILANGKFAYERFHITSELADDVVISAENVGSLFNVEGNTTAAITLTGSDVVITLADFSENYGIITSRKELSGYVHSGTTLAAVASPDYNADAALPTYPVGKERFLNGGDEEGGESPFVPEPFVVSMVSALADGSNWVKNAVLTAAHASYVVVSVTIDNFKAGHQLFFGSRYDAANPSNNRGFALTGLTTAGNISSLNGTDNVEETNEMWLWVDGVKLEKWGSITFSNEVVKHTIAVQVNPSGAGSVTGAGEYNEGTNCTLVATPASGKTFTGWYKNGSLVSSASNYTFAVTEDATFVAQFTDAPATNFSNVKIGSLDWNNNTIEVRENDQITGQYNGSGSEAATDIYLSKNNVSVGQEVTNSVGHGTLTGGAFDIAPSNLEDGVTYYLYATRYDSGLDANAAVAKYEYTAIGKRNDE